MRYGVLQTVEINQFLKENFMTNRVESLAEMDKNALNKGVVLHNVNFNLIKRIVVDLLDSVDSGLASAIRLMFQSKTLIPLHRNSLKILTTKYTEQFCTIPNMSSAVCCQIELIIHMQLDLVAMTVLLVLRLTLETF